MKCPKCNHENKNHSRFCVRCGASLHETKKKRNLKIIGTAALAIILIIALSLLFLTSTHEIPKSEYSVEIDGIEFQIPNKGYFKEENKYHFNFTNHTCSIREVDFFESESSSEPPLEPLTLSKYYPGSESYIHVYESDYIWCGLKVKKDNHWFHISMKTTDGEEAIKLFDWMYEHNDWEGHE